MAKRNRPAGPGKTTRFEVFKRDSFTCQYCGRSAPEVLLELDHIEPVAAGGGNELLNLITACQACNAGKRDRKLSDQAVVTKQIDQLRELEERRQQLEMLIQWKRGLQDARDMAAEAIIDRWNERCGGITLNENGRREIQKLVSRFGFDVVWYATEAAIDQYVRFDAEGKVIREGWDKAWGTTPAICNYRRVEIERPHMVGVNLAIATAYKRGNAAPYRNQMANLFERAVLAGIDSREISELLGRPAARNWKWVSSVLEDWIKEAEALPAPPKESAE